MDKNIKALVVLGFLFGISVITSFGQFPPWEVPAEANEIENPTVADKISLEEGKAFFNLNCKSCHGATGLGDGVIPSGNMTTKAFTEQTDGAIFYKLKEGRGQMPSFRFFSETDLWHVINYIRTFAEPKEEVAKKNATLTLEFEEGDSLHYITARVYEILENDEQTPAREIKVNFYVKRYFADMLVGGSRNYTSDDGSLKISFPQDLPGEGGILRVVARIEDSEFNPTEVTEDVPWGIEKETYWTEDRQLWKNNDYVPLWLLLSFFGVTGGILLTIAYVLLLVVKIRKAGAGIQGI